MNDIFDFEQESPDGTERIKAAVAQETRYLRWLQKRISPLR